MDLTIGPVIRRLRQERGITQEELARALNITFQAVSKWETNATSPDIALLPAIALYFGVTIDSLFSLDRDDYIARIHTMLRDERVISPDRFTWAEWYLKGILADTPADNEARTLLLELYEHRENSDSLAIGRLCEEGLAVDSRHEGLHGKLARLRERRKEPERLIAFLEPMVGREPDNLPAMGNLVQAYIRCRYFDRAEALLDGAADPVISLYRGDVLLAKGEAQAAVAFWQSMSEAHASHPWVQFEAAERLNRVGFYEAAIGLYERAYALQNPPHLLDPLYAMAFLYTNLGRKAEAIATWERILVVLGEAYHIRDGETVDWPRREMEKLKAAL